MCPNDVQSVPDDFPSSFTASTLPGVQLKFIARKIDDRYVVGLTKAELHERWAYCEDMAQQLSERTLRKQAEGLVSDLDAFYRETEYRVRRQGWDLSNDEVSWLMRRTRTIAANTSPPSSKG